MKTTKSKYRPAFSKEEVDVLHIILMDRYLTENNPNYTSKKLDWKETIIYNQLIGKINTLRSKIDNDAIAPAYLTRKYSDPAIALLEDLGAPEGEIATLAGIETKEQYWERCYKKVIANGLDHNCTVAEINAANEYKYLHGLMSPSEAIHFEQDNN